jgi:SNF2 family DNA or RNA helicase
MDINMLRLAVRGVDATYKTMIWNLSQNVDRETMGKLGLSQCLTPTGVPYVSNRGGPLVGEELLLLQGIPADDLLLTRETEDNLKDLAGNAMSTTVVGSCMLAALIVSCKALKPEGEPNHPGVNNTSHVANLVPRPLHKDDEIVKITENAGKYKETRLNLSPSGEDVNTLLARAEKSCRRCTSEGKDGVCTDMLVCSDCGQTSSRECAFPPRKFEEHSYVDFKADREDPKEFVKALNAALPTRMCISGLDIKDSDKPASMSSKQACANWSEWLEMFKTRTQEETGEPVEFNLRKITRGEVWTASYGAPGASIELTLDSAARPQWSLKIDPPANRGWMRETLERPAARMIIKENAKTLLDGVWEVALPVVETFDLKVEGAGERNVETFEAKLGLQEDADKKTGKAYIYRDTKRWSHLKVTVPAGKASAISEDINGTYTLLPKCGTALGALHKRVGADGRAMYLFLESGRGTLAATDSFIFSTNKRRLLYGEERGAVAILAEGWKPTDSFMDQTPFQESVKCSIPGVWKALEGSSITVVDDASKTTFKVPAEKLSITVAEGAWSDAPAIVSCKVPLVRDDKLWKQCEKARDGDGFAEINLQKGKDIFKQLAWFTSRLGLPESVTDWSPITTLPNEPFGFECSKCAPAVPGVAWKVVMKLGTGRIDKKTGVLSAPKPVYTPREDVQEAGAYEQALKRRPAPFKVVIKKEGDVGHMKISCNGFSLSQRARALLPKNSGNLIALESVKRVPWEFSWRVVAHQEFSRIPDFPKLYLTSNKKDGSAAQPPSFKKFGLRPEQLRSLNWMLKQEATTVPHYEEEVSEAILGPMGWRAEGRTRRPTLVRGGIVADQVGYGKTAITLGLIDAAESVNGKAPAMPKDVQKASIFTKATLVIVPPHLMGQWPKEVKKFCGSSKNVVEIKDMASFNKLTVADFENADIVIANFIVLSNDLYHERLSRLGGANAGSLPASGRGGRHFDAVYSESVAGLEARCVTLRKDRLAALDAIEKDAFAHSEETRRATESGLGLRLDGKKSVYKKVSEDATKNLVLNAGKPASPMKKPKSPAKKPKSPAKGLEQTVDTSSPESDDEDEDEDEHSTAKINSKVRNYEWSKDRCNSEMSKNKRDPWGLATPGCQRQLSKMTCPPLELFCWNRVVVDEFHYLEEKKDRARVLTLVLGLKSNFKWCLSGTPPHGDFRDVLSLAKLLGVHLGIDDVPPQANGKGAGRGNSGKDTDKTSMEKFSNMLDLKSVQWHLRRHEIAQEFLNRFVRQNIAEIDEIPQEEKLEFVLLPPAERAIYLELETHLKSLEMNSQKAKKSKKSSTGDREKRMQQVLEDSKDAEEALLKRCSHFDLAGTSKSALETCSSIIKMREKQLEDCKADLEKNVASCVRQRGRVCKMKGCEKWAGWQKSENRDLQDRLQVWFDDVDAKNSVSGGADTEIHDLIAEIRDAGVASAEKNPDRLDTRYAETNEYQKTLDYHSNDEKAKETGRDPKVKDARTHEEKCFQMKWAIREHVHEIRTLCKELCGRVRSLRYFRAVLDFNKKGQQVKCTGGKDRGIMTCQEVCTPGEAGVLSSCGHSGCLGCLKHFAARDECLHEQCKAQVKVDCVVTGEDLGCSKDHEAGGQWGAKLTNIVASVKNMIDAGDRVIVFVQFKDLKAKVAEALTSRGIGVVQVKGTVASQIKALDIMQEEVIKKTDPRCLLLTMDDESSSGINLTTCNHAVFVHPLLASSQQLYEAYETQAIGRIKRYGQKKTVFVHRFICTDTIDTEIWEKRGKEAHEERVAAKAAAEEKKRAGGDEMKTN